MYKNQIFKDDRKDNPIEWEEIELDTDETVLTFLKEELKRRSVIMYCESGFIDYVGTHLEYTLVDLDISVVQLRRLDQKEGASYRLILSDDDSLLSRGLDFRAHENGLTFIQAKSARDHHTLLQMAYRVGRQGEPARRLRIKGV